MTSAPRAFPGPSITVMHATDAPGPNTTYATHMQEGSRGLVTTRFFDWRWAMTGDYDVLHVHWPEYLIRGHGKRDMIRAVWRVPLLMRRLRRDGIAVVRTLHNLQPHESAHPLERGLERLIDARVVERVALNPATLEHFADATVILHGDYVERFADLPRRSRVAGRVLYFGLVRPYKGVESLVDAFRSITAPDASLRVVGRPDDGAYRRSIETRTGDDDRISTRYEFVTDAELVEEVSAAALVVLPYKQMHNSGSLIVALSLGTPVLAIDSPSNRAIQREVGGEWLRLFDGTLSGEALDDAMRWANETERATRPSFDGRDWATVGRRHREVYERAVAKAQGGRNA